MPKNLLYYGDNLDILRNYIKEETIDLIYLDPPFKSNRDYNVLFAEVNLSLRNLFHIFPQHNTCRVEGFAADGTKSAIFTS